MKVPRGCSNRRKCGDIGVLILTTLLITATAQATTQLALSRDGGANTETYKGVVELTVNPGFDNARVSITLDGEKIAEGLTAPYKVTIDFGPTPIEHKIGVTASTVDKKRVQWHATINRGLLPLSVKVRPVDLAAGVFEVDTTSPNDDPIAAVELWDAGKLVTSLTAAPYRFNVTPEMMRKSFVQVTARTKSGDEAADFWTTAGDVHTETLDVRTVPIFVSVVDGNGVTHDDIDRSLFRILDNESEAKIIEFAKAFDQPISIALLVDASTSMTYEMPNVTRAAQGFVQRTLKDGDHCTVFAVRQVPRREVPLTTDRAAVQKTLSALTVGGQTALYDGILGAIRELKDARDRRAIVVLSDGGDTSSMTSFDEIDKIATEAGIPIYFIWYDTGDPAQQQEIDRMNYLAAQTGGFVAMASKQNLQAKYREIEKDLRAQFAIRYQIADFSKHHEWRKVRVVLSSPKLTARTIRGYYAP